MELGLRDVSVEDFFLMGVWDHFYDNSTFGQDISTQYVNLPHHTYFKSRSKISFDDQYSNFKWFDQSLLSNDEKFHS